MDVRCERCRTQYVFGDEQVGPDGLTVRCSNCGHVFMVKKKALVVTVPVKPGDLREAPVSTADLHVSAPGGASGADRRAPSGGARPVREDPEKARPWNLRNRRGELYPFKDISTLQKWIVERKAARDDEVSNRDGPWRRLGDMLELEPFFTLVERAERAVAPSVKAVNAGDDRPHEKRSAAVAGVEQRPPAAQPTLIEFPPARAVFPGPGHQPAPAKTERFSALPDVTKTGAGPKSGPPEEGSVLDPAAAAVADEGPVMQGALAPVPGREPAWTSHPDRRLVERQARSKPASPRGRKRSRVGPVVLVVALAAGAAAVYVTNPGWLGLRSEKPGGEPPPDLRSVGPGLAQPPSPAQGETPPARPETPPSGEPTARPAEASAPAPAASPSAGAAAPATPPPGSMAALSRAPTPPTSAPGAGPAATPNSTASSSNAEAPPAKTPAADGDVTGSRAHGDGHGEGSTSPDASPAATPRSNGESSASPTPPASASPAPAEEEEARKVEEAPPTSVGEPAVPLRTAKVAPKRPPAAASAAEPQNPGGLERLLTDARRLRARGKSEAALRTYGQAVQIEPRNADALAGRGLCYLDLSRYGPAEASFHAALDADAHHAEALMGLAETFRYEGRRTEAVTYYQRYLAAHPDGEDAFAARSAIDALKE